MLMGMHRGRKGGGRRHVERAMLLSGMLGRMQRCMRVGRHAKGGVMCARNVCLDACRDALGGGGHVGKGQARTHVKMHAKVHMGWAL